MKQPSQRHNRRHFRAAFDDTSGLSTNQGDLNAHTSAVRAVTANAPKSRQNHADSTPSETLALRGSRDFATETATSIDRRASYFAARVALAYVLATVMVLVVSLTLVLFGGGQ